ncbi:alkaline phosphatase family protein [Granulicella paludicola]|uniref:alkaline phosphatase family protein n=1 Tax=Granulicella paludicola TaxID=474951 RepID=UPI0021E06430|nr:alkaline phosphatase family protein [Granulicella paludicola]
MSQKVSKPDAQKSVVIVITLDGFPARALLDPRLPMPTLRALIAKGTVASGMQPINPTVTWPNHTTLITGVDASKHHVVANGLITFPDDQGQPTIEPWTDKSKLVHAETLYEAAAAKGLTTGQVDWVAIYGAKGVNWQFGEKPNADSPIARELITSGMVTREEVLEFGEKSSPAWRDQVWTDAAVDMIEHHTPDLLLLHLLETDSIQHAYAPLTPAAYAAYAYADHCLERVVDAVRETGALDRTTFFVLSDHGFSTYTHTISPNAALVKMGLLRKSNSAYFGDVWVKAEGGAAELFIRNEKQRAALVPKLKSYFERVEGIQHAYTNEEARSIGMPSERDTDQAPQLYLTAKPDFAFGDNVDGELITTHPPKGAHGYLNSNSDMQALFVASGAAIRPGVKMDAISNLRVAPTIAKILGIQLPEAELPPLNEMLR